MGDFSKSTKAANRVSFEKEVIMKCNVGGLDRTSRMVAGGALLALGLLPSPLDMEWRIIVLVIAAIALITAVIRFCPANAVLGIDTCQQEQG